MEPHTFSKINRHNQANLHLFPSSTAAQAQAVPLTGYCKAILSGEDERHRHVFIAEIQSARQHTDKHTYIHTNTVTDDPATERVWRMNEK